MTFLPSGVSASSTALAIAAGDGIAAPSPAGFWPKAVKGEGTGLCCSSMPGVSSVQITFHQDKAPEAHAMPPGGFRLAIVNCWDLAAGKAGREKLRSYFLR